MASTLTRFSATSSRSLAARSSRSFSTSAKALQAASSQPHTLDSNFGKKHIARGLSRLTDAVIKSGKGSYVETEDGRKLLDFTCGIAVTNLGRRISRTVPLRLSN